MLNEPYSIHSKNTTNNDSTACLQRNIDKNSRPCNYNYSTLKLKHMNTNELHGLQQNYAVQDNRTCC